MKKKISTLLVLLVLLTPAYASCSNDKTGQPCTDLFGRKGTWEWDNDLSNALAGKSKPKPGVKVKAPAATVAAPTSTTKAVRSGWECDADGDED